MHPTARQILLKTNKKLFLEFFGEHQSIFNGYGLEFSDVREYDINDDVRHLNWKITARNQKPTVNLFSETKQLNIVLVYLNSGGLHFGSVRSKKELAVELLGALSLSVIHKKDLLSTLFFDSAERYFHPATQKQGIFELNVESALALQPLGCSIDYELLEAYLMERIRRRSLIVVIGDFLEMPSFSYLGYKHELYCAIVRDRVEEDPQMLGSFDLVDTASLQQDSFLLDQKTMIRYAKAMEAHDKVLYTYLRDRNIRFEKFYTDEDPFMKLHRLTRI